MGTVVAPHQAVASTVVRRRLVADLAGSGLPPALVDDAALLVSELVANAVRHGRPLPGGVVEVGWSVDGDRLRLEVRDGGGNGTPSPRPSRVSDTEGRGLAIVAAVAVDWGVESTPDGTTVWAVLERH